MSISLHGVAIGGGIAIGRAHLMRQSMDDVSHYALADDEIVAEIERFEIAVRRTRKQLEQLRSQIPENAPVELGAFLSLHIMLLTDTTISREPCDLIESQRCNAEWALKLQVDQLLEQFDAIEDGYLRERKQDMLQVVERIFKNLAGQDTELGVTQELLDDTVLIAHDLSPADMVYFKDNRVAAFVTDVGGTTSHTAILGRSLDLPSVIALHNARALVRDEEMVIVDGIQGVLIVDPEDSVLLEYRKRQRVWRDARRKLSGMRKVSAETKDGVAIELLANIEMPDDITDVKDANASGIGLFRSEFMFLTEALPNENEQYESYRKVAEAMKGLPVTVRTMDLGADKNPRWMAQNTAPNPALGLTGIRLSLHEPSLFRTQLRALLRASIHGRIRILFPMISSAMELKQALQQLEWAKEELTEDGIVYSDQVEVGAMIEVPAAALIVNSLLKHLDFISIGTNDLIQYTLAVDRNDDAVSHLYDPMHPAVLKLIAHTIRAATRAGKPVAVCGEMAGDVRFTRLLLGVGLRRFSMHPANLLAVKQIVRNTNLDQIAAPVMRLLRSEDPVKIGTLLEALNSDAI